MGQSNLTPNNRWPPSTVGSVIGVAFCITLAVFFVLRDYGAGLMFVFLVGLSGWVSLIIPLSVVMVVGTVIGSLLAKIGCVPSVSRKATLALALIIATAPFAAGYTETFLRKVPIQIPDSMETVQSKFGLEGSKTWYFESSTLVPALHEELVRTAKEAGWHCRYCQYQPSTNSARSELRPRIMQGNQARGKLVIVIWPAGKKDPSEEYGGFSVSDLNQIKINHRQVSNSIELVIILEFFFLLGAMLYVSRP